MFEINILMIRKAKHDDVSRILELLSQVNDVHAEDRPDFFIKGKRKYSSEELERILYDATTPVFVCEEDDDVKGYAFCVIQDLSRCDNLRPNRSLYIDDICVDVKYRRQGLGRRLYEYVLHFAKEEKCYNVTLNVWEKNSAAKAFYESLGMKIQKFCMETIVG